MRINFRILSVCKKELFTKNQITLPHGTMNGYLINSNSRYLGRGHRLSSTMSSSLSI